MNIKPWMMLAAALVAGLGLAPLTSHAQESDTQASLVPKRTGRITGNNVNLRGKATLYSETVAQLQDGDRVSIVEEITLKEPKAGEPQKWLRILLPKTVPVWVHSSYVDPATQTTTASLLNVRSGPGQNYSVLARIPRGTTVKELEKRGDWIKIENPPGAYAFVAASLVSPDAGPPPVEVVSTEEKPMEPAPEPEVATTAPEVTPAKPEVGTTEPEVATTEPEVKPAEPKVAPTEPPPITEVTEVTEVPAPVATPPVTEEPVEAAPAATEETPASPEEVVSPEPAEEGMLAEEETSEEAMESEEPPKSRDVIREGIVRRSASIQAPSDYVLQSLQNRRTLNYLHVPTNNTTLILKDFYGARVVVTGQEVLDERWPKTPVIKIETLETVP